MRSTFTLTVLAGALASVSACSSGSSTVSTTPFDGGTLPGTDGAIVPDGGFVDESGLPIDDGATPPTEFDAVLSGAEVVPAVMLAPSGMGKFLLQPDGVTLQYDITQTVNGATAVGLHIAAPAENAPTAYPITPVSGHMTGMITLNMNDADNLANGKIYVDVQSSSNPAGAARGQLVPPGSTIFVTMLNGDQELPPVATNAMGHASFIMNATMDTVRYHLATSVAPSDINVHRAIGAQSGPVAFPFAPNIGQTVDGTLMLGANDANDITMGRFYVNVVTNAHPAGELRGQIMKPGEALFTTVLSGAAEVPPTPSQATGGAQFLLSPDQTQLRYEVVVSGTIPTEVDLASGAMGTNGTVLASLMLNATGAQGTLPIQPTQVSAMSNQMLYVNVKTASSPNGELRGQLAAR
jgi:hypothetical protein